MRRPPWVPVRVWAADMVREGRRRLLLEAAECQGDAIRLDRVAPGSMLAAALRLRAAWCSLGAALLGHRG